MVAGDLPMPRAGRTRLERAAAVANVLAGLAGFALMLLAVAAAEGWAQRHFLPTWAWPWEVQLRILLVLRLVVAALGLLLVVLVRPRLARSVAAGRGRQSLAGAAVAALAIAAAFAATEGILRTRTWRANQERWGTQEPLRQRDAILGWTFVTRHAGTVALGGRTVHYATNALGYRSRSPGDPIDPHKPTIVFAGESLLFGYGLEWSESIPAQVQALTGTQTASATVNGYSTDQSFLLLRRELARFDRPVAVVMPFLPILFDRNLDEDRPHLDAQLRWHPARPPPLRLVELARRMVRYRSTESIEEGIAMTQAVLRASLALARSRNARLLIVVPQFLPESPAERAVRKRVLDSAHLPYILVPLDNSWRVPGDRHPDARGARAIAAAIAAQL
jgi:hypothetical protein